MIEQKPLSSLLSMWSQLHIWPRPTLLCTYTLCILSPAHIYCLGPEGYIYQYMLCSREIEFLHSSLANPHSFILKFIMQFYALEFRHSIHLVLSQIAISIGLHTAEHFKSHSGVDFHTLITFAFFRASVFPTDWQRLEFIWILFKFGFNSTLNSTFWSLFQIVFYFISVKFWFLKFTEVVRSC